MSKLQIFQTLVLFSLIFFSLSFVAQALTYQQLLNGQGKVLGASTVGLVQSKSGLSNGAAATAITAFTSGNAQGNTVVVAIEWYGSATINAVSDSQGNSYSLIPATLANVAGIHTANLYTEIAYATGIKTGANTVTVTFSTTTIGFASLFELTSSTLDQATAATGNSANTSSGAITTTASGDFVVANTLIDNGFGFGSGWFVAGSGWTLLQEIGGGNENVATEYQAQTNAGSLTGNFTSNFASVPGPWTASVAAFKPAAAVPSDTTPPSTPQSLSATAVSSSAINLTWTASTDDTAVTGYKIYRGGVQIGTSATNSYSDSGLSASTQYTYTVSAYDAAGNNSAQSTSANATTQAPAPQPPTISSFTANPTSITSGNSSTLSWTTSNATTLSIDNTIGSVTGQTSKIVSPTITTTYTLTATNAQGSVTSQATVTVTVPDTTAPTVPTNLSATAVSSSGINLSWIASTDNVAVTGYKIYRGGTQIGTSNTNSYSDSGLTASTAYTYTVSAYDAANNNSALSLSASATTSAVVAGTNIYIAQSQAGTGDGSSCANAYAYSFFNTAANWGSGAGKIGPGVTVHICGTITGAANAQLMSFHGSGTAGNPVTLLFEANAVVQAPYFFPSVGGVNGCGGGICGQGESYIVIDGGSNGIIQNTANGTGNAHNTEMVDIHNCNHCTVQNLNISNVYVRTSVTDVGGNLDETQQKCIEFSGSNLLIKNNTISNAGWCLFDSFQNGDTNIDISYNKLSNFAHGIMFATSAANAATNIFIHDNEFSGMGATWNGAGCPYHQDGIHVFGVTGSSIDQFYFYNNYFHGDWGLCPTGWVFVEAAGSGTPSNMKSSYWFNNLGIVPTGQVVNTNGWIDVASGVSGTQQFYNNTIIGPNNTDNTLCLGIQNVSNVIVKNNTISNCGDPVWVQATASTIDNNYYGPSCGNGGNCFVWNGSFTGSFANWKTASGGDSHSVQNNNPLLSALGLPQAGSPVLGAGINLMSLATGNLSVLASDSTVGNTRAPIARPASSAWDIGAYQYSSGSSGDTTLPSTPTSLSATAISSSAINLSWTASTDDVAVTGYKIFRNGSQVGSSVSTAYSDTSLSAGTLYSYTVSAYDAAGNNSTQSSSASATTNSGPDVTPPTASITSPSFGTVSGSLTFSATASDPTVTGQVTSGLKLLSILIDGSLFATSSSANISKSLDTTTLTNASHTLTATAQDNAGNVSSVASVTVTVNNAVATKYPRLISLSSLEGIAAIPANQSITVTVVSPANGSTLETQSSLVPTAAKYTITFLSSDPQLVNIRIKANGYLSQLLTNIDTTVNSAVALSVPQLSAGDFNNDNTVNALDYSILNTHWLQNFPSADINVDGLINSLDFAILKNNWNKGG